MRIADIRTSTNPRFLSFINGINNLSISSDCFPKGAFNYNEPSHREAFAWTFLTFFSLYLPQFDRSLIGLEFRMLSTSLTKATRRVETAQGVSRSIIGMVATFESRTTVNPQWDFRLCASHDPSIYPTTHHSQCIRVRRGRR